MLKKIISMIIVLAWIIAVFILSSQNSEKTLNTSGAFIHTVESVINTEKSQENTNLTEQKYEYSNKVQKIVRKNAHYFLYTLGGMALSLLFNCFLKKDKKVFLFSFLTGVVYAISDEIHQKFVPGRTSSFSDILIDTLGVLTGIVIFIIIKNIFIKCKLCHKNQGEYDEKKT